MSTEKNNELVVKNQQGNVDLSQFTKEEIEKYQSMTSALTINDNNSILSFGSDLQKKLSEYSDEFLDNVKSFDAGEIGSTINNLLHEISYADPNNNDHGFVKKTLLKIPGVKSLVKSGDKYLKKYESVTNNIDNITSEMDKSRLEIIKDNTKLGDLFEKNRNFIGDLEEHITAGHIKLDELKEELAEMEQDPNVEDIDIADKQEFISRLSKRVHDMELTRVITVQSLPQIRMVQNNNNTMVEKIQSSITSTIPVWKNQISLAVTLKRQSQIAEVQNKIYETTNTILTKNAQTLKSNSIDIAKQNEQGIVSTDAIKEVNTNLIETLNEIKKVKEDGEKTRMKLKKELEGLEGQLNNSVIKEQF